MKIEIKEINKNEILKYLSYRGSEIPEEIYDLIEESMEVIKEKAQPKYSLMTFPLEGMHLVGTTLTLQGQDIQKLLKDSKEVVLLGATLGISIDQLIRTEEIRNLSRSVVYDSCASAAVESVCNQVQEMLENHYEKKDLYLTDRFSPGYGDMPLESQRDFHQVMNLGKTIGVQLSSTNLMIPRKSITAVMGIADKPQARRFSGCENCRLFATCQLRKDGHFCGKVR